MKYLLLLLALSLSPGAFAWDCTVWSQSSSPSGECYKPPGPALAPVTQQVRGVSKSRSSASSKAAAAATAQAASTANNAGNTQATVENSSVSLPRQTPPAVAGDVQPTSSCKNARNGGASSPIAGLSFGVSTRDEECDMRETARMLFQMGHAGIALEVLCKTKAMKGIPECEPDNIAPAIPMPEEYPPGERDKRIRERGGPEFDK